MVTSHPRQILLIQHPQTLQNLYLLKANTHHLLPWIARMQQMLVILTPNFTPHRSESVTLSQKTTLQSHTSLVWMSRLLA